MLDCRRTFLSVLAAALAAAAPTAAPALGAAAAVTGPADVAKLFKSGQYAECIEACAAAIEAEEVDEEWPALKVRAELATGRYAEALATYEAAVESHPRSAALRLLGHGVYRANDRPDEAEAVLAEIREAAAEAPWRYTDASGRVALGRALFLGGADARQVLELFYDRAKKDAPDSPEPHLAAGELALAKGDFAVAAESFREAVKRDEDDPDAHLGLARAYAEDDAEQATAALNKALQLNPRHVESLLFHADNLIDREDYPAAVGALNKALAVNARDSRALAYRAVLAHLRGDEAREQAHRTAALEPWKTNPEVDHLIGRKLSQKYRFSEGEAYQRRAMEFDPDYRPAKAQLCQDLLRLGKEDEGWALAAALFEEDQYNVVAYNLVTLHDELSKYRTIESEHVLLRMEQREAEIYGQRAMRLLTRAREALCEKYGADLPGRVIVEIFPRQKDFAIRTFGLPGGDGFLGVCFGGVITVNSPASRGANPSNWEAVLWHEFCHAVTLAKTRNKMPRWLSEGISVYEERAANPAWGQVMNPQYRELILAGGAAPVSRLSGAFLRPPSPMHLQFAYYESSMVVEYVVGRFGLGAVKGVLDDLGKGLPINDALARHTEPIEALDKSFAEWLKAQAVALGPKVDWERPTLDLNADSAAMRAWNAKHPNSFFGLLGEGRALIAERKWREAKAALAKAAALYPACGEPGGPYLLLAQAHRELGEKADERRMLEKHLALDADAIEARLRVAELAAAAKDWKAARRFAEQALAVNPLVAPPHRWLAEAAEALGDRPAAIEARRTLLTLEPLDRAEQHYRLARLLHEAGRTPEARREVVRALEEAPRFRAAHRLLLQIAEKSGKATPAAAPAPKPRPAGRVAP